MGALHTWAFGFAHTPVGESSSWWGVAPRGPWAVLSPAQDRQQETLSFSSLFLPIFLSFPSPQSVKSLFRETGPPAAAQVARQIYTSPSTSSARKVMLAHCWTGFYLLRHHCLCQHLPFSEVTSVGSNLPTFGCIDG